LPAAGIGRVLSARGLDGVACGGGGIHTFVCVRVDEGLGRAYEQTSEQSPDREHRNRPCQPFTPAATTTAAIT
jgi:hypothetical protein